MKKKRADLKLNMSKRQFCRSDAVKATKESLKK